MVNVEQLRRWMVSEDYRPSTINTTISDTLRLVALIEGGQTEGFHPRMQWVARRLLRFVEAKGLQLEPKFWTRVLALAAGECLAKPKGRSKRQKEVKSFGDEEWRRLLLAVEADPRPEARVLEVMAATGLRIGDVLRLTKKRLAEAVGTGVLVFRQKGGKDRLLQLAGAPEAWGRLWQVWEPQRHRNVAKLVCPDGDGSPRAGRCAYLRVDAALKELAAAVGIRGRIHTHRFRRTVGVQALRITGDLPAVQQLLGHANFQTTMKYLDEARPERVAEIQRMLRDRYRTDK